MQIHRQRSSGVSIVLILISAYVYAHTAGAADKDPFVNGRCDFSFPGDHNAHPQFNTEWWYYTGNLSTPEKEAFGFQMTLFRTRLAPPDSETQRRQPISPWRTSQIYIGHAAISHIDQNRHYSDQTIARAALGMAGSKFLSQKGVRIFLGDWSVEIAPSAHHIRASTDAFSLDLTLIPDKPWVAHGQNGYSRKGDDPQSASCYYSFTRMKSHGTINIGNTDFPVSGLSWMDREYFNASLDKDTVGWDWFSMQLSDQSDIMLYMLRQEDGTLHSASQGSYVDSDGKVKSLSIDDIYIKKLDSWKSEDNAAQYPSKWRIVLAPLRLNIEVSTRMPNQQMLTKETTGIEYYEGSIEITGYKASEPVQGLGYVELTGYTQAIDTRRIW